MAGAAVLIVLWWPRPVGEKRPELVSFDRSGVVTARPASDAFGHGAPGAMPGMMGGKPVVFNMNVATGVAATVRAEILELMPVISERVTRDVMNMVDAGGNEAKTVGRRKSRG